MFWHERRRSRRRACGTAERSTTRRVCCPCPRTHAGRGAATVCLVREGAAGHGSTGNLRGSDRGVGCDLIAYPVTETAAACCRPGRCARRCRHGTAASICAIGGCTAAGGSAHLPARGG